MNSFEKTVFDFRNIVGKKTKSLYVKSRTIYCSLEKDEMLFKIASFVKEKVGRTIAISIVKKDESYILNYIFCLEVNIIFNIKIQINNEKIKSISSVLNCSSFFQDEINKKYKIKFIEENNIKILEKRIGIFDTKTSVLDDIAKFKYETKDEIIKNVEIDVNKSISMPSKNIDYLNSFYRYSTNNNSLIYSLAIEEIAEVEVSKKAKLIRMIAEELIRASSHLFNFSIFTHLLKIDNLMIKAIKVRNTLQDIKEILWNSKLDCNINIIGGVNHDINEIKKCNALEKIDSFMKEFQIFHKIIINNEKLNKTIGFGRVSKNDVYKFGLTGPIARASSINNDIRDNNPYLLYDELAFQVKLGNKEDAYSRMLIRLDEVFESIRIVKLALELLPNKNLKEIKKINIPKGETIVRIEAPRGELFYYLRSEGSNRISRIITRTPTTMNWQMLKAIMPNNNINQMPLLLNSIDPCVTCSLEL